MDFRTPEAEEQALLEYAGSLPDQAVPETPPPVPTSPYEDMKPSEAPRREVPQSSEPSPAINLLNQAGQFSGILNTLKTLSLGLSAARDAVLDKPVEDRSFKGVGDVDVVASAKDVQTLRQNRNDPLAVEAFNRHYDAEIAQRYLNNPSQEHIDTLFKNRDDPLAVQAFDSLYGGTSRLWLQFNNPKSSNIDRAWAAQRILEIMESGTSAADSFMDSTVADIAGSVELGARKTGQEQVRAVVSGIDTLAGTNQSPNVDFGTEDTRVTNYPIVNALVTGISQFVTGRVIVGGAANSLGLAATASRTANFVREMGLSGITDAFSFDPNDPLLGDLAKKLGMGDNWFTKYGSIEAYTTEAEKRLARTAEGAILGSIISVIALAVRGARALKAGRADEAKVIEKEVIEKLDDFSTKAKQLDLDLGNMNNADEAAQVRLGRQTDVGVAETARQGELPLDMPFERRLDALPDSLTQPSRPNETISEMEGRVAERWGVDPQRQLDLGEPPQGPIARGGQGDLFEGAPPQTPRQAEIPVRTEQAPPSPPPPARSGRWESQVGKEPPTAANPPASAVEAPQASRTMEVPAVRQEPSTASVEAPTAVVARQADETIPTPQEAARRTPEQFIDDVINQRLPAERVLRETMGTADTLPASVRRLLDEVQDFSVYNVQALKEATNPILRDFIDVARASADDMQRIFSKALNLADAEQLRNVLTRASAQANKAALELKRERDAILKQKVVNSADLDRVNASIKEATDLIANVQKASKPLGTYAGRLLWMGKLEGPIGTAMKGDVAKLRAAGVPDADIIKLIDDAVRKLDVERLNDLKKRSEAAFMRGDVKAKKAIDKEIADVLERLGEKGLNISRANSNKVLAIFNQLREDVIKWVLAALLSGVGTTVRNVGGTIEHSTVGKAFLATGLIKTRGVAEGTHFYRVLAQSRGLGMRHGFKSVMNAYSQIFKDAGKAAWRGESKTGVGDFAGMSRQGITPESYGVTSAAGKAAINTADTLVRLMNVPLRFSDEFLSAMYNRQSVGELAGYRFLNILSEQIEEAAARLRDPNISAADRAKYKAQVDASRGRGATVFDENGNRVTLEQFITKEMDASFDETGRFTNEAAIDRSNYILMRNELTSVFGRQAEAAINASPEAKFMIPFLRTPVNVAKRTSEMIPGMRTRFTGVMSDVQAELKSLDPLVRERAVGKVIMGYPIMGAALWMAYNNVITWEPTRDAKGRQLDQASSSVGPFKLHVMGKPVDLVGMGPISMAFIFAATAVNSIRSAEEQWQLEQASIKNSDFALPKTRVEYLQNLATAYSGAIASAIGSLLMEQPTLGTAKDIVDMVSNITKGEDGEDMLWNEIYKSTRNQISKVVPNMLKSIRTAIDPQMYDIASLYDAVMADFGSRDSLPLRYDVLGRPISNKNPYRGLMGPLAPLVTPDTAMKEQYVIDSLKEISKVNGWNKIFVASPPDKLAKAYGIDFRNERSFTDRRRISDAFANEVRRNVDPATGMTMTDRLYGLLKQYGVLEQLSNKTPTDELIRLVGNNKFRGDITKTIDKIITEHRQRAWDTVFTQEVEARLEKGLTAEEDRLIRMYNRAKAVEDGSKGGTLFRFGGN